MNMQRLLLDLGWPEAHIQESGICRWSSTSDFNEVKAQLIRQPDRLIATVDHISLESSENLMHFEIQSFQDSPSLTVNTSTYGNPPEHLDFQETKALFLHMVGGMKNFKFTSSGPLQINDSLPHAGKPHQP